MQKLGVLTTSVVTGAPNNILLTIIIFSAQNIHVVSYTDRASTFMFI